MNVNDVIAIDKDILGGIPVFKGTRVPIKNLFDYIKSGDSLNDFLNDFDYIPKEYCLTILRASGKLLMETLVEHGASLKKKTSISGMLKVNQRPI